MKTTVIVVAALLAASFCSAQGLPSAPSGAVDLHLDMAAEHMRKDAWCRETSIYWALGAGSLTAFAADRSVPKYDQKLALGLGLITAAGFATFQIVGARHGRKASRHIAGSK